MRKLLVLLCVSVPSFMLNLDANIVAVSLPSIARSLNADFASIEWVISAYTLTFASLVLPAGMLADRYGRKAVLLCGLSLFTLASFLCGAAPNVVVLNAARALQGLGAALQLSAALATLSHEFRGAERARAFAFWGSVIGIGITLGPIAGGLITQTLGWQWAFYINIPVGLAVIVGVIYAVRDSKDPHATGVDLPGSILFTAALFLLTLALISGNHEGWDSTRVLAEFAASAVLFVLFIVVEARQSRPMLDLSFFKRPTYIGANIAGLAYAGSLLTMLTYLPLYLQGGLGFEPQKAGLMMLPMAIPLFLVPRVVSKYLNHVWSGRALLTVGLCLVGFGMLWVGLTAYSFSYLSMMMGMLIAGIGAGFLNGETAKVSMTVIPPERAGMAAGVGGTIRFSGIVVGFAALGAILFAGVRSSLGALSSKTPGFDLAATTQRVVAGDLPGAAALNAGLQQDVQTSFAAGYQAVFLSASAVALLAAIATWLLVRADETAPIRGESVTLPVD
ncbi:MAG: DHA2 family efflux MFS transporter permease subunit [Bradyrhizobiaceae bacterium]|nr:MAG: DHA2 family efflux MFS transporter permease subunit [Bradyrhizobiaceae bacterium]